MIPVYYAQFDQNSIGGDSGGPVYTVPQTVTTTSNTYYTTNIVGSIVGHTTDHNDLPVTVIASWANTTRHLGLNSIS